MTTCGRAAAQIRQATAQIRQATALVRAAAVLAVPEEAAVADAADLAELLGALQKVVGATIVRYARRSGAGAAGMVAGVSGTALGSARRAVEAAQAVDALPEVRRAFAAGELSVEQAAVIAPAAAAVPEAAGALLDAAKCSSLRSLRAVADQTLRRARSEEDEVARERRIHARRFCRSSVPEGGGLRIEALLSTADGAKVLAALAAETDAVFAESWAAGSREPRERLCADALVRLVTGSGHTRGAHLVVRVDAGALRRGAVDGGEVCEVPGIGPVSVATARSLLGDGFLTLLVTDGVDVRTVTSTSRVIPRRLAVALAERDPWCVVPGCGATEHLEIDHWRLDFARHGPTELDNLCRLCPVHHRMKTREGWRLGGGPGRWRWVAPRSSRPARARAGP